SLLKPNGISRLWLQWTEGFMLSTGLSMAGIPRSISPSHMPRWLDSTSSQARQGSLRISIPALELFWERRRFDVRAEVSESWGWAQGARKLGPWNLSDGQRLRNLRGRRKLEIIYGPSPWSDGRNTK